LLFLSAAIKRLSHKTEPAKKESPEKGEMPFWKALSNEKRETSTRQPENGNKSIRRLTLATYLHIKTFGLFFQGRLLAFNFANESETFNGPFSFALGIHSVFLKKMIYIAKMLFVQLERTN